MTNDTTTRKAVSLSKLERSLQVGGDLESLVRAETSETVYLLIDVSYSMKDRMRNGRRRIDGLRATVAQILGQQPVPMVQFGKYDEKTEKTVGFTQDVPEPSGGTPLDEAIQFAGANGAGRAVVISDGMPNDGALALAAAKAFGGRIDVVFVGDPGERGSIFLDDLAQATGGERFEGDLADPKTLGNTVVALLAGDVDPNAPPIHEPWQGPAAADSTDDDDFEDDEDLDDEDDDLDE